VHPLDIYYNTLSLRQSPRDNPLFRRRNTSHLRLHRTALSIVVDPIELGDACGSHEEVYGGEGVIDGGDDEGVADLRGERVSASRSTARRRERIEVEPQGLNRRNGEYEAEMTDEKPKR